MKTIELIKKLIDIDSTSSEEKISRFISEHLISIGFKVEKVLTQGNRSNIVARFGKSSSYLSFYGHMDTVHMDEKSERDPLKLEIDGKKAYGLGVEDMKGAIAAILKAAEFAVENKYPLQLIFGVDEEQISRGAHDLVDSGILNNINFLISGESGQIKDLNQPFNVCYGRKGRILFQATVTGKKAHAAEEEKGVNAINEAARFIKILSSINFPKHEFLDSVKIVLQSIHSDTTSFSTPDKCVITFSVLTTPGITSESVKEKILSTAKENNIEVNCRPVERDTPYGESYEINRDNKFLKILEKEIFDKNKVKPTYASSVADENIFANRLNIPVISLGPIGGGGHTKEEWLDLNSLEKTEQVYKDIIRLYNE